MFDFRTDLASERKNLYKKANNIENEIDGIEAEEKQISDNIKLQSIMFNISKSFYIPSIIAIVPARRGKGEAWHKIYTCAPVREQVR